jgi:hypothetical protein
MKLPRKVILFLIILVMVFIMGLTVIEQFNHVEKIDYYVITMRPEERIKNIDLQHSKMRKNAANIKIEYVDAVVGKDMDVDQMKESGKLIPRNVRSFSASIKNELGCYLSHMKAYEMIAEKRKPGFSVIFEDDFNLEDGFLDKLEESTEILNATDFDFCFLGMLNGSGGEHLKGDVYRIPNEGDMWEAHAYLVKNENIPKIMKALTPITDLIDVAIFNKGKSRELNVYTLQPTIVSQGEFGTSIRTT